LHHKGNLRHWWNVLQHLLSLSQAADLTNALLSAAQVFLVLAPKLRIATAIGVLPTSHLFATNFQLTTTPPSFLSAPTKLISMTMEFPALLYLWSIISMTWSLAMTGHQITSCDYFTSHLFSSMTAAGGGDAP